MESDKVGEAAESESFDGDADGRVGAKTSGATGKQEFRS